MNDKYCIERNLTLRSETPGIRALGVSVDEEKENASFVAAGEDRLLRRNRLLLVGLNAVKGSFEMRLGLNAWRDISEETYSKMKPKFQSSRRGSNFVDISFTSAVQLHDRDASAHQMARILNDIMDIEQLKFDAWRFVILDFNSLKHQCGIQHIHFVCHRTDTDTWYKQSSSADFHIDLETLFEDRFDITKELSIRPESFTVSKQFNVKVDKRVVSLFVGLQTDPSGVHVEMYCHASRLVRLHWGGSCHENGSNWQRVSSAHTKKVEGFNNVVIDEKAMQTRFGFERPEIAIQKCVIEIDCAGTPEYLVFVLKEDDGPVWINHNGKDFVLPIPQMAEWTQAKLEAVKRQKEIEAAAEAKKRAEMQRWEAAVVAFTEGRHYREQLSDIAFSSWKLQADVGEIDCIVHTEEQGKLIVLTIEALSRVPLTLHWGCVGIGGETHRRRDGGHWICPGSHLWPADTVVVDPKQAVQTPLVKMGSFNYSLKIVFPATSAPVTNPTECGLVAEFGGVVFVLKETGGNRWFKAEDGRDILVRLATSQTAKWTGSHKNLVDKVVEAEVEWDHMTLMHRYNLCNELISQRFAVSSKVCTPNEIDLEHDFWAWIYTWNRFSFLCWLDWQRRYNTKPRDLSHACEALSCKVAAFWKDLPRYRIWLKLILTTMGRGGSAGQAIRDRILDIMHKHKIPETAGNFYEQWHQKLHNNTTRDDIGICKAVIRYLETNGSLHDYWQVLHQHGINKEILKSYDRPITLEPFLVHCDRGSLIYDFKQYLDILQEVHDALDLQKSACRVKHCLKGDAGHLIDHVVWESSQGVPSDFGEVCQRLNRLYRIRRSIVESLEDCNHSAAASRDLLLLDSGLETQQSVLLQNSPQSSKIDLWVYLLVEFIDLVSRHDPKNDEWRALTSDWSSLGIATAQTRYSDCPKLNALLLKALIDRATRAVGEITDLFQAKLGEPSLYLGLQVGVEKSKLNVFVDEVLRGTVLFAISLCIKSLEPMVRKQAELPPWQLISWVPKIRGVLTSVKALTHLQEKVYEVPTILISDGVNGEEEIPNGVQGVLVRSASSAPDILSHISVRARNAHCLLAVCFNPDVISDWETRFQNSWVELEVTMGGSNLSCKPAAEPVSEDFLDTEALTTCSGTDENEHSGNPQKELVRRLSSKTKITRHDSRRLSKIFDRKITQSRLDEMDCLKTFSRSITMPSHPIDFSSTSDSFLVTVDDFDRSVVGSKSLNLKILKSKLSGVLTPRAFAFPYGALQKVLNSSENSTKILPLVKTTIVGLNADLESEEVSNIFARVQMLLMSLSIPQELEAELVNLWTEIDKQEGEIGRESMRRLFESAGIEKCWRAACRVWSSMYAMRPWISLAKADRSFMELNMAILVQELVAADYAFVLHSKNPFKDSQETNGKRQMYGEIVTGLGEVLVSNYPGRALSWIKTEGEAAEVVAFPAKSEALLAKGSLIFRSDSNGEDLEGFAGAGLFESVAALEPDKIVVSYAQCPLVTKHAYRQALIDKIGNIAFEIEDAFELPMDIEGCVFRDQIVILQARPQV